MKMGIAHIPWWVIDEGISVWTTFPGLQFHTMVKTAKETTAQEEKQTLLTQDGARVTDSICTFTLTMFQDTL